MRAALTVLGILFCLTGLVWILQGFNVLLGSFMSGRMEYAALGVGTLIAGAVLIYFANRRSKNV
jgi:hypothetical protein